MGRRILRLEGRKGGMVNQSRTYSICTGSIFSHVCIYFDWTASTMHEVYAVCSRSKPDVNGPKCHFEIYHLRLKIEAFHSRFTFAPNSIQFCDSTWSCYPRNRIKAQTQRSTQNDRCTSCIGLPVSSRSPASTMRGLGLNRLNLSTTSHPLLMRYPEVMLDTVTPHSR